MASGVAVSEECIELYRKYRIDKVYRVIVLRLGDGFKEIIPESEKWQMPLLKDQRDPTVAQDNTEKCLEDLKNLLVTGTDEELGRPRWIVFYYDYVAESSMAMGGRAAGKEVLIKWCPESAKVKARMCFASSAQGLKDSLPEFSPAERQADCMDEINAIKKELELGKFK